MKHSKGVREYDIEYFICNTRGKKRMSLLIPPWFLSRHPPKCSSHSDSDQKIGRVGLHLYQFTPLPPLGTHTPNSSMFAKAQLQLVPAINRFKGGSIAKRPKPLLSNFWKKMREKKIKGQSGSGWSLLSLNKNSLLETESNNGSGKPCTGPYGKEVSETFMLSI